MKKAPPLNSVAADPSQWSAQSQRSVQADWTRTYTDIPYRCWRCNAEALFSAEDQRYTYEVKKAPIDQRRSLCRPCWDESHRIARTLRQCEAQWAEHKKALQADPAFLARWLQALEGLERYGTQGHDLARKNMLRKLLDRPPAAR